MRNENFDYKRPLFNTWDATCITMPEMCLYCGERKTNKELYYKSKGIALCDICYTKICEYAIRNKE